MPQPRPPQSAPNAAQSEAIRTTAGPVQIIAELIAGEAVNPENLLVVMFADKAAKELVTRVSNKLNQLGTFRGSGLPSQHVERFSASDPAVDRSTRKPLLHAPHGRRAR